MRRFRRAWASGRPEHDVRGRLDRFLQRFRAVLGLADDVDVGLLLEHHLQAAPEQGVVIDDENSDGFSASYGRWLSTVRRLGHKISIVVAGGNPLATRLAGS